jgi:hypothetical protein
MYRLAIAAAGIVAVAGLALWAQRPGEPEDPPVLKKKDKPAAEDPVPPKDGDKKPEDKPKDDAKGPPAPPEESAEDVLQRVANNLRTAEDRLANKELGDGTRQVQDDIIKDLDSLINKAEQQPPPDGGGQGGDAASDPMGGGKAGGQQGMNGRQGEKNGGAGGRRRTARRNGGTGVRPGDPQLTRNPGGGANPGGGGVDGPGVPNKNADVYKDDWGRLPETLRASMKAYANTKANIPEYDILAEQYKNTIRDEARRKGD